MTRYVVGWDVAQAVDFSALCVAEVLHVETDEREAVPGALGQTRDGRVIAVMRQKTRTHLLVRHLDRLEQGLSYPDQVRNVVGLLNSEPLKSGETVLVVDRTGAGRPVSDLIEMAELSCDLALVTITSGDAETREGYRWTTPKRDLVASAVVMLQERRLRIAAGLPLASTLADELREFEVRISATGRNSYSAPPSRHDDLLMALCLCTWFGGDEAETQWF